MKDYLWLLDQAWTGVKVFWPISVVLFCAALVAFANLMYGEGPKRASLLAIGGALLLPFSILWIGVAFKAAPGKQGEGSPGFVYLVLTVLLLGVASILGTALSRKWLQTLVVVIAAWWVALLALFVSVMSVTGSWI